MNKDDITELLIESFWNNKKYFVDAINDGDFIGILLIFVITMLTR